MPANRLPHALHTGRAQRPVLVVADCQAVASFYYGYWFSHWRR